MHFVVGVQCCSGVPFRLAGVVASVMHGQCNACACVSQSCVMHVIVSACVSQSGRRAFEVSRHNCGLIVQNAGVAHVSEAEALLLQ